jgi:hypothetical protein
MLTSSSEHFYTTATPHPPLSGGPALTPHPLPLPDTVPTTAQLPPPRYRPSQGTNAPTAMVNTLANRSFRPQRPGPPERNLFSGSHLGRFPEFLRTGLDMGIWRGKMKVSGG